MIRTVIAAFLFCLTSSIAYAQFRYDYAILCDSTQIMIESLRKDYQEKLSWTGDHVNDNSIYSLWVNPKDNSWTLLKSNKEFACILGVGAESKFIFEKI